jgi:hypothetical protein
MKKNQNFPFQGLPECTRDGIFGVKIYQGVVVVKQYLYYDNWEKPPLL